LVNVLMDMLQNGRIIGRGPQKSAVLAVLDKMVEHEMKAEIEKHNIRKMEAAVAREERLSAVGRLAAGLAHEIRNPLASLSGSVQLLQTESLNPLFDIMLREMDRLNGLVEDFLDSARPAGVKPEPCAPDQIVDDLLLTLRNDLRFRDRQLLRAAGAPVGLALLDPARFRQLLWNLLLNAAQATPAGGAVRVGLSRVGGDLRLRVEDDGAGIPAEVLPQIFDPFFTTKEVGKGTGLGLSICFRIMNEFGGAIRVATEPGLYTEFALEFPPVFADNPSEKSYVRN
jgi:signal transduction histidine kinase